MDTTSHLRLVTRNIELSEAIEQEFGDCLRGIDVSNADLTALSLSLRTIIATFATIKNSLQDPCFPRPTDIGSSQAQKDALAALTEVLGHCERFSIELRPIFIGLEKLKGNKMLAETALRNFITAKAGLRATKSRLEELQECLPVVLAVVCVHGFLRRPADWTLGVDVEKLIAFRKKPVRYGVDSVGIIKLHTLVAKTILAAKIYSVNGMKMDEPVDVNARTMIEAWTASTDGLKTNNMTDPDHQLSDLATQVQNKVKNDTRGMGKTAVNSSTIKKHPQVGSTQSTTLSAPTEQGQIEEISSERALEATTIPKAQRIFSSSSDPNFQRYPKAVDQQTIEIPTTSTAKIQNTKLVKNPSSSHRRASLAIWMKKWYKPR